MTSMKNKVALITGASRGIGRAIGEALGREGATVAINYRSRLEEAAEAVRAIEQAGGTARAFHGDVAELADIERLFDEVTAAFGGLDIVIANAGLPFIGVHVADVSEADFDRVFGLNAKGSFFVLQQAARRVRDHGRIIDISTSTTMFAGAGMGLHSASKAGSKLIVEVLALELGHRSITVNSVMLRVPRSAGSARRTKSLTWSRFWRLSRRAGSPASICWPMAEHGYDGATRRSPLCCGDRGRAGPHLVGNTPLRGGRRLEPRR